MMCQLHSGCFALDSQKLQTPVRKKAVQVDNKCRNGENVTANVLILRSCIHTYINILENMFSSIFWPLIHTKELDFKVTKMHI